MESGQEAQPFDMSGRPNAQAVALRLWRPSKSVQTRPEPLPDLLGGSQTSGSLDCWGFWDGFWW